MEAIIFIIVYTIIGCVFVKIANIMIGDDFDNVMIGCFWPLVLIFGSFMAFVYCSYWLVDKSIDRSLKNIGRVIDYIKNRKK